MYCFNVYFFSNTLLLTCIFQLAFHSMHFKINDFSYNDSNGQVTKGQEKIQLTKIQKKLFDYFLAHPKTTLSKQTLMDEVWGRTVTENSIEKTLSKLRNIIEDNPLKPEILITHFGHGISFEGKVSCINEQESKTNESEKSNHKNQPKLLFALIALVLMALLWIFYPFNQKQQKPIMQSIAKNQRILVLPMEFKAGSVNQKDEKNINHLMQSELTQLDSEGVVLFNNEGVNNNKVLNKHWQIDNSLIFMQTRVSKNGAIYDAVVELSNGVNTLKKVKISATNLLDLATAQTQLISDLHQGVTIDKNNNKEPDKYLQALDFIENKKWQSAQKLLEEILDNNDKDFQARFSLAQVYYELKAFDKAIAQLQTLKSTSYYRNHSAQIELELTENFIRQDKHKKIIADLTAYLSSHLSIGKVKKAKIMQRLADAYVAVGNTAEALKFYKQSVLDINDKLFPEYFTRSYFGQARIANQVSTGKGVYELFSKALHYAKQENNIAHQATILDSLSVLLFHSNQWQKGLQLKRESIALMELIDDKSIAMGTGLGVLASYLLERGLFNEGREVVDRIKNIADEIKSDHLTLIYNHYDISLEMNAGNFDYCQREIDKEFALAKKINDFAMMLNNVFLQMELLLARKDTLNFLSIWQEKNKLFQQPGLERYQIFMDLYLARYYEMVGNDEKAIELIAKVSELAKQSSDFKFLSDAQVTLAKIYLQSNPQKALDILMALEQYNPNPNPYLEVKAKALAKLDKKTQALSLMMEAKAAYNEAWKPENQALLEELQQSI